MLSVPYGSAVSTVRFSSQYRTVRSLPRPSRYSSILYHQHIVYIINPHLPHPLLSLPYPTLTLPLSHSTLPISSPSPSLTAFLHYLCTKGWEDFNDRHLHSIGTDRWVNHISEGLMMRCCVQWGIESFSITTSFVWACLLFPFISILLFLFLLLILPVTWLNNATQLLYPYLFYACRRSLRTRPLHWYCPRCPLPHHHPFHWDRSFHRYPLSGRASVRSRIVL